jgi:hypothetical protein
MVVKTKIGMISISIKAGRTVMASRASPTDKDLCDRNSASIVTEAANTAAGSQSLKLSWSKTFAANEESLSTAPSPAFSATRSDSGAASRRTPTLPHSRASMSMPHRWVSRVRRSPTCPEDDSVWDGVRSPGVLRDIDGLQP